MGKFAGESKGVPSLRRRFLYNLSLAEASLMGSSLTRFKLAVGAAVNLALIGRAHRQTVGGRTISSWLAADWKAVLLNRCLRQ